MRQIIARDMQGFASGGQVLAAVVLTDLIELRDRATWLYVENAVPSSRVGSRPAGRRWPIESLAIGHLRNFPSDDAGRGG